MNIRTIMRKDRFFFRLIEFYWLNGFRCLKLALQPKLLRWQNEESQGWNATILGIRITYERVAKGWCNE